MTHDETEIIEIIKDVMVFDALRHDADAVRVSGSSATFRVDGRSFNMGKLRMLSARLGTEDIEVEIRIDAHHTPDPDSYSDPGPDDHVRYTIKGIP